MDNQEFSPVNSVEDESKNTAVTLNKICAKRDFNHTGIAFILALAVSFAMSLSMAMVIGIRMVIYSINKKMDFESIPDIYLQFIQSENGLILTQVVLIISLLFTYTIPFFIYRKKTNTNHIPVFNGMNTGFAFMALAVIIMLGFNVLGGYFALAVEYILSLIGISPSTPDFGYSETSMLYNIFLSIAILVIAPVFEEFVFRGVLLNVLKRYGSRFAIIMSSLIFGLFHGNFIQFFSAFFIGIIFAYVAVKANSIIPSIIMHFINNSYVTFANAAPDDSAIVVIASYIQFGAFIFAVFYLFIRFKKINSSLNLDSGFANSDSGSVAGYALYNNIYDKAYKRERTKLFFSSPAIIALFAILIVLMLVSLI